MQASWRSQRDCLFGVGVKCPCFTLDASAAWIHAMVCFIRGADVGMGSGSGRPICLPPGALAHNGQGMSTMPRSSALRRNPAWLRVQQTMVVLSFQASRGRRSVFSGAVHLSCSDPGRSQTPYARLRGQAVGRQAINKLSAQEQISGRGISRVQQDCGSGG